MWLEHLCVSKFSREIYISEYDEAIVVRFYKSVFNQRWVLMKCGYKRPRLLTSSISETIFIARLQIHRRWNEATPLRLIFIIRTITTVGKEWTSISWFCSNWNHLRKRVSILINNKQCNICWWLLWPAWTVDTWTGVTIHFLEALLWSLKWIEDAPVEPEGWTNCGC